MNRAALRFLGFRHDQLAAAGGSQEARDRLLAQIDALAQEARLEPRVGEQIRVQRRTPTSVRTFLARVLSVHPADGFVYVSWLTDDGRFGNLEHGKAEAYGDSIVGTAA